MSDLLETLGMIIGMILGLAVVIAVVLGFIEGLYLLDNIVNKSTGNIYCGNKVLYSGRLYRESHRNITESLQAPVFGISIKNEKNFFSTEKYFVCSDNFKIEEE